MTEMQAGLSGKVALVTGSTSGIGRSSALALGARGAHVLVSGRNIERADQVLGEIRSAGGKADFLPATLSDVASARALGARATEAGGGQVDILVNNVGTAAFGPALSATEADFDNNFTINVKIPFFLVAELAPGMAERGAGSIINISTMVASFGMPGMAIYGASRAALELLTKAWAAEFGPMGVRVNAIAPGPVRTPPAEASGLADKLGAGLPTRRPGLPGEIAAAVAYLASDEAGFTTGTILHIDGGRTAI
ncbi:MAG TPA: SDR family oxidoreductase [Streptosporangiaceae bacterium]|jgi:NAD(P)-dependent dehydrogenase (short-subunit alcohol dehydrogenase family)|nr:SDR family oxidoreductase [Streptosporangiaceae bacterium]